MDKALYLDILHSKGLTCENLANFMHISKTALSNKLNGHSALSLKDLRLMCEFAQIVDLETISKIFYLGC